MAVHEYKNIEEIKLTEENRGRRIREKDRILFEREDLPVWFGDNRSDNIEFALYDMSDNLLAWKVDIPANPIILDGGLAQLSGSFPQVVVEPLKDINSVGFEKGTFRFSYQFFRNRVGSHVEQDKVYISEISPSRMEVRILPVFVGDPIVDSKMKRRFQHFKHNDIDVSDAIRIANIFIRDLTVEQIKDMFNPEFLAHFQEDYAVSGEKLNNIIESIRDEATEEFMAAMEQEDDEFISLSRARNLFERILADAIDRHIPYLPERSKGDAGCGEVHEEEHDHTPKSPCEDRKQYDHDHDEHCGCHDNDVKIHEKDYDGHEHTRDHQHHKR